MKRISITLLASMLVVSSAFGCRVEYINDTNNTFFAFDENHNEGHMVAPGEQHVYGEKGRHPVVTFYTLLPDGSFKKSYRIIQNACALNEADKILPLAAAVANDINMEIYSVTNFELNPEKIAMSEFGSDVLFINDTGNTIFAFDENHNQGYLLQSGEQHSYGEKGYHPIITFYIQATGGEAFKKSYRITQKALLSNEIDRTISLSKVIDGEVNSKVYSVTNFDLNPEKPACCMHDGEEKGIAAIDEPLTSMDEE